MQQTAPVTDHAVIKAMSHPLRVRILDVLQEGAASPNELSKALEERIGNVAYHVGILTKLGIVKLTRTAPRRGATEHWYELVAAPVISNATWGKLPSSLQDSVVSATLRETGKDIERAARSGGLEREDIHLSRVPLTLDPDGWSEVSNILDRALDDIQQAERDSLARIKKSSDAEAWGARAVLMLFETPRRSTKRTPK